MFLRKLKRSVFLFLSKLLFRVIGIPIPPVPSVSAIIAKKDEILVLKIYSKKEKYILPGGILQKLETFEEALKREVLEETGLTIRIKTPHGTYATKKDFPAINLAYLAEIKKGRLRDSEEGKAVWKNPKDIVDKLDYPDNKLAIEDFIKKQVGI